MLNKSVDRIVSSRFKYSIYIKSKINAFVGKFGDPLRCVIRKGGYTVLLGPSTKLSSIFAYRFTLQECNLILSTN